MLNKMKDFGIKTSLKLIAAFLAIGIVGSVAGACLYMVYSACTVLVAGESLAAFSVTLFVNGLFASFPVCMMVSSMMLTLYLIRHPAFPIIPICMYFILMSSVWIVLVPFSNKLSMKYRKTNQTEASTRTVSPGFFRHDDGYILFYSKITDAHEVDGVCIDDTGSSGRLYTYEKVPLAKNERKFSDSLIEETVAMPKLFQLIIKGNTILESTSLVMTERGKTIGYSWWLCFASFGLALLSVIGLRRVSNWRLLNTFLVIFTTAGIIGFNVLCYGKAPQLATISGVFDTWFKQTAFLHNAFPVVCNILIAFIFLVWGLCLDIFKKNTELDEEGNPI